MSLRMSVTVDDRGLANALKTFPAAQREALEQAMRDTVDTIATEADRTVPVNKRTTIRGTTGGLRGSQVKEVDGLTGRISYTAPYAKFVHDPTQAHDIFPVNAKALMFAPSGATEALRGDQRTALFTFGGKTQKVGMVFSKHVRHPGTPGQPWLANAVAAKAPLFGDFVKLRIRQLWARLTGRKG